MKIINYNYDKRVDNDVRPVSSKMQDIVEWVYRTHLVEFYVTLNLRKPMSNPDCQDYCQEIYLQLCEVPQEKWDEMWNYGYVALKSYVCQLIKNNNQSSNSRAYYNIRKSTKNWIMYEDFDEVSTRDELVELDRKLQRETYENTSDYGDEGASDGDSGGLQELD